jgi:hypothetical protein
MPLGCIFKSKSDCLYAMPSNNAELKAQPKQLLGFFHYTLG